MDTGRHPSNYVAALLVERETYVRSNRPDRVRLVDIELARFGVQVADDGPELAVEPPPERRSTTKSFRG